MGDPFREHNAREKRKRKEEIADTHEPIVLWVKTDDPFAVKKYIKEMIKKLPSVGSVASVAHEPRVKRVLDEHRKLDNNDDE